MNGPETGGRSILEDRLRALPGTKQVRVYGAQTEEILISVDWRKLTSLGLSIEQVSRSIAIADTKVRAGQIRGSGADLLVEVAGEFRSLERIRKIPLQNATSGQIVRVADVADISRTVRKPAVSLAFTDNQPAILVAAKMGS